MKRVIYSLMLLLLLVSCSTSKYITKEVPVEVIKEVPIEIIKTEYISNAIVDSTFVKDSIDRSFKGDTLIIYKEKQVIKFKYKADTIVVHDTIPTILEVQTPKVLKEEVQVEVNKLYWYQKTFMYLGILALVYILILLMLKYLKR